MKTLTIALRTFLCTLAALLAIMAALHLNAWINRATLIHMADPNPTGSGDLTEIQVREIEGLVGR